MSMQAINFAMTLPVVEPGPRLLLFVIAHHVHWKTGAMHVGQSELADEVKSSVRSVRRWLIALEEAGYISRDKCRSENGHQDHDEITLLGYVEWQDVLYNGGTIVDPKTRGKPVENVDDEQADNLAAGEETSRTNLHAQADKSGGPAGHCCPPIKEPLRTINNPKSAQERAKDSNSDLKSGPKAQRARTAIDLTKNDSSWKEWISHLKAIGHEALAERADKVGMMTVNNRWPHSPNDPLPQVPRPHRDITPRMIGEGAAK